MKQLIPLRHLPTAAAGFVLLAMFVFGSIRYEYFASATTISNLLADYSYVGIAAVGATLVILSGGIDLSVGAMIAFTSILTASLVGHGWHPLAAGALALAIGAGVGAGMGVLIHVFALPAFMVTLAGMFAMRALGFLVHEQSLSIDHPFFDWASRDAQVDLGGGAAVPLRTMLLLAAITAGIVVARYTRFGRNVYAIGGAEKSARAMGVPIASTRIGVYVVAGCCSALAGWVFALYKHAGDPASGVGLELDVIASVVIGGTLLSGGVGSMLGTLLGVMILGMIRTIIDFQGNLNSAWTWIATGVLLLAFVALQNLVAMVGRRAAHA